MELRLADVIRAGATAYFAARPRPTVVHRAVRAILACGTAILGGHAGLCEAGHMSVWYNSCRNRCCPRCAFRRVQLWLERQARILLGCAHHHVVFTIPHNLNDLWLLNQAVLGNLLFASARDALFALAADPRYLGATPGAIMALHTWGQQLTLHPHIHCLVTAGGVGLDGLWRACRRRHFLPAEPLKRLFRDKFLDGLNRLQRQGQIRLPEGWVAADVRRLTRTLGHKRWNVHVRERYRDPTAVLNYLGRYLHGGPFGERRLLAFDGKTVSFRYKDYRVGKEGAMDLPTDEFVRRYLQHVPPQGFHMVRGFGLYRRGSKTNHLRDHLSQALPLAPEVRASLGADASAVQPAPRSQCKVCAAPIKVLAELKPRVLAARAGPDIAA